MELPTGPSFATLRSQLHDLVAGHPEEFGPTAFYDPEDDEPPPEPPVFLTEWVFLAAWVDAAGETHLTRVCSENLAGHHRQGLQDAFRD